MTYRHPFDPVPEGECCCVYFGDVDMTYTDLACPIHGVNGTHPMGDQQGRRPEPEEPAPEPAAAVEPLSPTTASLVGDERALKEALMKWCDSLEDFDSRAVGLSQIQAAKGAVAEVEGELVDLLVPDMPGAWVETPVGILKRDKRGGYSSWDADSIWTMLLNEVRKHRFDPATGEMLTFEQGAERMLEVVKDVVASPSFKVTSIKRYGIDPDEVRATSPVRKIVRFVE